MSGWCASGTPISGYVRVLVSRASWNVMTRVTSPCRASTCRSNIKLARGRRRRPARRRDDRDRAAWNRPRRGFGLLNAALHFANGIEILADLAAVAGAELSLQAGDVFVHPIEHAGASCAVPRSAPRQCRHRRTGVRRRRADALRPAAAWSATTTKGCSGRRTRSRCRTGPPW